MIEQMVKFLKSLKGDPEEASRQLRRPAWMSRRGFLRALGVTTATVLVAPAKLIASPSPPSLYFWNPIFIGKSYILEDVTMNVRRENNVLEFCAYETVGAIATKPVLLEKVKHG